MELLIFGLVNGATLILLALGFSFVFGISRIANFAHGAFYVLASFLAYGLLSATGLPYPLIIICTILSTAGIGALMYWLVIFRLKGQMISEVIATFSLGIAIIELFRLLGLSGTIYGLPTLIDGGLEIGEAVVDYQRIAICGVGLFLVAFLWYFTHYTKVGLACRGMAQDEDTALCFGIDTDLTAVMSLAVGGGLVATAAITISPLGFIDIDEGYRVMVFALAVGVVGGLESTMGIVAGALLIGFAQSAVSIYVAPHFRMVVPLGAILLVLAIRPSGLFGQFKELEERV